MAPLLTIILVVILVGVLIPKRPQDNASNYGYSVKVPYFVFIVALASSPFIGAIIGTSLSPAGNSLSFLQYLWVGIVLSLPLSLVMARTFGRDNLPAYWRYLESFGNRSRTVITYSWAFAAVVAIGSAMAIAVVT